MNRREVLTLLPAAGVTWPAAAWGQQSTIGLLGGVSPESYQRFVAALLQGLRDTGFNEGENLRVGSVTDVGASVCRSTCCCHCDYWRDQHGACGQENQNRNTNRICGGERSSRRRASL